MSHGPKPLNEKFWKEKFPTFKFHATLSEEISSRTVCHPVQDATRPLSRWSTLQWLPCQSDRNGSNVGKRIYQDTNRQRLEYTPGEQWEVSREGSCTAERVRAISLHLRGVPWSFHLGTPVRASIWGEGGRPLGSLLSSKLCSTDLFLLLFIHLLFETCHLCRCYGCLRLRLWVGVQGILGTREFCLHYALLSYISHHLSDSPPRYYNGYTQYFT